MSLIAHKKEATALLIGNAVHGVDAKGRVFIPSKWRDDLGATLILTHGILGREDVRCLFGMSIEAWKTFGARFSGLPETDVLLQDFRRMMYQNAAECELDKQGRILIPLHLREYAQIDKDATLLGVDNRIEIWNAKVLDMHNQSLVKNYNEVLLHLTQKGI